MSFFDKFLSILSIVSGPPEKKMGIKASNTAEVRLFIKVYRRGRYCPCTGGGDNHINTIHQSLFLSVFFYLFFLFDFC